MLSYKAPKRDIKFLMNEVFDFPAHYKTPASGQAADSETVDMIIDGIADFAENVISPIYQPADAEGCHFDNGKVTTPKGFKEAYAQFVEGGWHGICYPEEYGGMNLPSSLNLIKSEMIATANLALVHVPRLDLGCGKHAHAIRLQRAKRHLSAKACHG